MTSKTTDFIDMDTDPELDDPCGEVQAQFNAAYNVNPLAHAKPTPNGGKDKSELETLLNIERKNNEFLKSSLKTCIYMLALTIGLLIFNSFMLL